MAMLHRFTLMMKVIISTQKGQKFLWGLIFFFLIILSKTEKRLQSSTSLNGHICQIKKTHLTNQHLFVTSDKRLSVCIFVAEII